MQCTGWSKDDWAKVEVLLKCGTGKDASTKQELQVVVVLQGAATTCAMSSSNATAFA